MTASAVSVVRGRIEIEEEFPMTASNALSPALRGRARGFDLLAMRVSLAVLLWARRRADRHAISRDDHARRMRLQRETERREHGYALRIPRG